MSEPEKYWGPVLREIMKDSEFMAKFPEGISAGEMYNELVARSSNVAISASVLDVADYMREMYGRGSNDGTVLR